ncbi:MAG: hypothetical protein J5959_17130 [Butyrivibrio sp.]|nr:hypothetical protein [Butyrivibrio sp.]
MNISLLGTGDDRIKSAYHASKNIYDNVLTLGDFLSKLYSEVECHTDGSIAYFKCRK